MKKITLIAILVTAGGFLTPYFLGIKIERTLVELMTEANAKTNGLAVFELERYQRGWFSSTAILRSRFSEEYVENLVTMQQQTDATPAWTDIFHSGVTQAMHVSHGPFTNGGFGLGQVSATLDATSHPDLASLLARTKNLYLAVWSAKTGLSGLGQIIFEAPKFELPNIDGTDVTVNFAGINATGSFDLPQRSASFDGQSGGLSIQGMNDEFVIENISFTSNTNFPQDTALALGNFELAADRIVLLAADQTNIDAKQLRLSARVENSARDNNLVNMEVAYEIAETNLSGAQLKNLQVNVSFENLASQALEELQRVRAGMSTDPQGIDAIKAAIMTPTYDLLAAGIVMKIEPISFIYNDKPFSIHLEIATVTDQLPPKDQFSFDDPDFFASIFVVSADLSIDKDLATTWAIPRLKLQLLAGAPQDTKIDNGELTKIATTQAPLVLATLVGQGLLIEDGSNYTLKSHYDQGQLTVNGADVPVGAFLPQQ